MKVVSVVGARPQFVKHAPLSRELSRSHQCILVHTGQHYDYTMSKIFFEELDIPTPDYNLGIGSGTHAYQTGEMMKGIESVLLKEEPDAVLIYGDTNSTLAAALAAVKLHIKVAHVEAGLRMFDKSIPEEVNRVLADYCSDLLFCPTQTAVDNLRQEGMTRGVHLTGDVMVDALNFNKERAEKTHILDSLGLNDKQYIVLTLHRAANTDSLRNLGVITDAVIRLASLGNTIVFPVHPRTEKVMKTHGLLERLPEKVRVIEPLGYLEFLKLMNHASKILTDSGGIQKEAYILKVPCITLMDTTPWVETLQDGWNVTVGVDSDQIVDLVCSHNPGSEQRSVFGSGACRAIARLLNGLGG